MCELLRLMTMKNKADRAAAGIVEPPTLEEIAEVNADLRERGIIDDGGLIRGR